MTKLVWNQVGNDEWHAGGLRRSFSIITNTLGHYSLRARTGDNPSIHVGVFQTLKQAKARAQSILNKGVTKAAS
jgi:hypothetical protein